MYLKIKADEREIKTPRKENTPCRTKKTLRKKGTPRMWEGMRRTGEVCCAK